MRRTNPHPEDPIFSALFWALRTCFGTEVRAFLTVTYLIIVMTLAFGM